MTAPQRGTAKSVVYSLALFAAVIVIGLVILTVSAYVARNDGFDTSPRGKNPMVTYQTDAEREHDDKVAATQVSAAQFAVRIGTAMKQKGATQRGVMRAIRDGALAVPQSDLIATRLMWVKPTPDGITLCVESDVTAAVVLDTGNVFTYDSCNGGVPQ